MFFSQNNEQSQKQIISKMINQRSHLNKIQQKQPLIFLEILKVFGINESRQYNNESLYKLKQRLINICIQEKQDFLEYLSLPKFKQISQHALELLKISMEQIKQIVKNEQQKAKSVSLLSTLSQYIPQYQSLYDIENFHIKLFELYTNSNICPKMNSPVYIGPNIDKQTKIFPKISQNSLHNSINSNFVKSQPQQIKQIRSNSWNYLNQNVNYYRKGSKEYHTSQQVIDQLNTSKFNSLQSNSSTLFKIPSRTSKRSSSQLIEDYQPTSGSKMQKVQQSSKIYQDYSQPLSILSQSKHRTFEVLDPNFKNCLCKGKIQKISQQQLCCQSCMKKFHFQCLRLSNIQQQMQKKKCPICTLQEVKNDFFEVVRPPLTSSWIVYNKENNVPFAIRLNQSIFSQMRSIYKKSNNGVYLKMITISKRSQITDKNVKKKQLDQLRQSSQEKFEQQNGDNLKNQNKKSLNQIQEEQNVIKNKENKNIRSKSIFQHKQNQTSIQLTERYINEIAKSLKPVLSLNFGFSPQYMDKINNKIYEQQRLIYFGIYQIRKKVTEQIINNYKSLFMNEIKNISTQGIFSQKALINLIATQKPQNNNFVQTIKLKSENLFEKDSEVLGDKQMYPIRLYRCRQLSHVFELEEYFVSFETQSNNIWTMNLKKLNPDSDCRYCPKCIQIGYPLQQLESINRIEDNFMKSIYLDYGLYNLLNKKPISQNIKNSEQVEIQLIVSKTLTQPQDQIQYKYKFKNDDMLSFSKRKDQSLEKNSHFSLIIEKQPLPKQKNKQISKIDLNKKQLNQFSQSQQSQHESIDYQN